MSANYSLQKYAIKPQETTDYFCLQEKCPRFNSKQLIAVLCTSTDVNEIKYLPENVNVSDNILCSAPDTNL